MHTTPNQFDLQTIAACWQAFNAVAHVHPIRSPEDYARMVALMDSLLVATGDNEDHPLSSLLDLVGDVVEKYEQEHYRIEAAAPKDALRFLMDERGLKQEDLAPLIHQNNLSAILAGKRKINATFVGLSMALPTPMRACLARSLALVSCPVVVARTIPSKKTESPLLNN